MDATRQSDGKPNSNVVAETTKLLANSYYGYQIMDRVQYTVTKCISDEKTNAATNSKFFNKLHHVNKELYEVELAKTQTEHKQPIIVGFFVLQFPKLWMFEMNYNFLSNFVT